MAIRLQGSSRFDSAHSATGYLDDAERPLKSAFAALNFLQSFTSFTKEGEDCMADQHCAHGGCNCKIEQGKEVSRGASIYCSEHCANAGSSVSGTCECGHPGCK